MKGARIVVVWVWKRIAVLLAVSVMLGIAGAMAETAETERSGSTVRVRTGADVVAAEGFARFAGKRVGLVCNLAVRQVEEKLFTLAPVAKPAQSRGSSADGSGTRPRA